MEKSGISSYGASLNPHVQWRGRNVASVHVMAACALGVDLGLHNGGPDHGRAGDEEAGGHALEGGEADLGFAHERVHELVEDGDHDDYAEGIEVVD